MKRLLGSLVAIFVCMTMLFPMPSAEANPVETGPSELKVMTFNVWLGGMRVDFLKVIDAIRAADADIIGLQEAGPNLPIIANHLGYYYHTGLSIISRYPIFSPPVAAGEYAFVMLDETRGVAVSNVHLRAYPYGPYMLRDGQSEQAVMQNEQFHYDQIISTMRALQELAAANVPVFLIGDFNVPSHLDWTQEVAEATDEPFRVEFSWPVSAVLELAGFRDTYREMFPDPVAYPAYTWSPGYPVPTLDPDEVHDRIDFVYASGPSTTLASQIVGEEGPITDIVVTPWPSDHRAVVSTFTLTPVALADLSLDWSLGPTITTDQAAYPVNAEIVVTYENGSGRGDAWSGIYPSGTVPGPDDATRSWRWSYVQGVNGEFTFRQGTGSGAVNWPLPPGDYEVHLFRDEGYTIIATASFSVE